MSSQAQPAGLLSARESGLWSGAAAIVLAAHVVAGFALYELAPPPKPAAQEEALTVDLTPFTMTEVEESPPDSAVEELTEEQPEEITEEVQPEDTPVTETEELETAQAEEAEPEIQEDEPDVVEEVPEITPAPKAEVVIQKPKPKPVRKPPVIKKVEKPVEKARPRRETAAKPTRTGRPKSEAIGTQQRAKAQASRAPTVNRASWDTKVRAAIVRRLPRGKSGQAIKLSFVVSSSGSVISASVVLSSGDAALDRQILSAVRGTRVPAPPAGLVGSRYPFNIPVTFR